MGRQIGPTVAAKCDERRDNGTTPLITANVIDPVRSHAAAPAVPDNAIFTAGVSERVLCLDNAFALIEGHPGCCQRPKSPPPAYRKSMTRKVMSSDRVN